MVISRTPYRLSFLGGGTDYPRWYRAHGGAVLATTIDKYCYLSCRYLPPFFEHRHRVVWSKIETVQAIDEISHPAVREVLRYLQADRGLEIHHDGDLPARSGIGSSSAFTVGLLHALHTLAGRITTAPQLARESIHVERDRLRETVGSQDQVLAAFGGFNHVTFRPDGEFAVEPLALESERVQEFHAHLMLFYTGVARAAAGAAAGAVDRFDRAQAALARLNALVEDGMSLLANGRAVSGFGELLHEAWSLKRCLGSHVSTPAVDEIYAEARRAGALGGKLLGAGGGGFILLFAEPPAHARVRERLHQLLHVPFQFEPRGSQIILGRH